MPSIPRRKSHFHGMNCCPKACATARCLSISPARRIPTAARKVAATCRRCVQLTDIGLAWKVTAKDAVIYAFSCDTGAPLPGVKMQTVRRGRDGPDSATTDASGLATVPRAAMPPATCRPSLGGDSLSNSFRLDAEHRRVVAFPDPLLMEQSGRIKAPGILVHRPLALSTGRNRAT